MKLDMHIRIPEAPVITRKKVRGHVYIYYEYDRTYDKKKRITYPKRASIGKLDADGLMVPNANIRKYLPGVHLPGERHVGSASADACAWGPSSSSGKTFPTAESGRSSLPFSNRGRWGCCSTWPPTPSSARTSPPNTIRTTRSTTPCSRTACGDTRIPLSPASLKAWPSTRPRGF